MRDEVATTPALYLEHFGFAERPFTLQPDPRFLFWSRQHERAFAILEFGMISGAPITLMTGEIGAGKTTLLQAFIADQDPGVTVGLISNAQGDRGELLQWILNALDLGFDGTATYVQLFRQLQSFLLDEYAAGRRVVLILDEAQNLSLESLEELRMLTNINAGSDVLIQLVLTGQPELREMILGPSMCQLAQRVAASFHLEAMGPDTVAGYIRHRLCHAGGSGAEFTDAACALIHRHSGGIPRLVNQLAELALLFAWSAETDRVDAAMVDAVLDDGAFFPAHRRTDYPVVRFRPARARHG